MGEKMLETIVIVSSISYQLFYFLFLYNNLFFQYLYIFKSYQSLLQYAKYLIKVYCQIIALFYVKNKAISSKIFYNFNIKIENI